MRQVHGQQCVFGSPGCPQPGGDGDRAPASPPRPGFHYESNNETDKREFEKAVETIAVSFSST